MKNTINVHFFFCKTSTTKLQWSFKSQFRDFRLSRSLKISHLTSYLDTKDSIRKTKPPVYFK